MGIELEERIASFQHRIMLKSSIKMSALESTMGAALDPSAFVASPELLHALEQHAHPVPCDGERVLFRQGEDPTGAYILLKGQAVLTMQSDSGKVVMDFVSGPGSVLGLPGLIGNQPFSLTAVAQAGAQVSFVTRNDLQRIIAGDPVLSMKILQVLAAEVRTARRAILNA
jgi:CRP-like cAMP-binding protein